MWKWDLCLCGTRSSESLKCYWIQLVRNWLPWSYLPDDNLPMLVDWWESGGHKMSCGWLSVIVSWWLRSLLVLSPTDWIIYSDPDQAYQWKSSREQPNDGICTHFKWKQPQKFQTRHNLHELKPTFSVETATNGMHAHSVCCGQRDLMCENVCAWRVLWWGVERVWSLQSTLFENGVLFGICVAIFKVCT